MSYGTRSGITYGLGASTGEHKGDSSDTGDLSESFDMGTEGDYVAVVTGKLNGWKICSPQSPVQSTHPSGPYFDSSQSLACLK